LIKFIKLTHIILLSVHYHIHYMTKKALKQDASCISLKIFFLEEAFP